MKFLALTALVTLASALLAAQAEANYAPPTQYSLTSAAAQFREQTYRDHPCLAKIIDLENGYWDPTLDYNFGHGNVYEAYGLPQAYPGTKMSSAGADWRTSRTTQLRWMINYAVTKFGSECGAWYSRSVRGNY